MFVTHKIFAQLNQINFLENLWVLNETSRRLIIIIIGLFMNAKIKKNIYMYFNDIKKA